MYLTVQMLILLTFVIMTLKLNSLRVVGQPSSIATRQQLITTKNS